jgi:predicted O-methyltransferase YrrM
MSTMTGKRLVLMAVRVGVVVLALVAAVSAFTGREQLALAAMALLVGLATYVLVEVRSVIRVVAAKQRDAARAARAARTGDAALVRDVRTSLADLPTRVDLRLLERRVLDTVEGERRRAVGRHGETAAALKVLADEEAQRWSAASAALEGLARGVASSEAAVTKTVRESNARIYRDLRAATRQVGRDIEASLYLKDVITPRSLLPATGSSALDPRSLAHLLEVIRREEPTCVVELGSGTSTVWLGYALEGSGARIVSLEHDPGYAEVTRTELRRHGLEHVVDLRLAPLEPLDLGDGDRTWYSRAAVQDLQHIDVLFVDGPPGSTGPLARWPAVPALGDRLRPGAVVVLDDADRPGEKEAIERWTAEVPGLTREEVGRSRLAVLRWPDAGS